MDTMSSMDAYCNAALETSLEYVAKYYTVAAKVSNAKYRLKNLAYKATHVSDAKKAKKTAEEQAAQLKQFKLEVAKYYHISEKDLEIDPNFDRSTAVKVYNAMAHDAMDWFRKILASEAYTTTINEVCEKYNNPETRSEVEWILDERDLGKNIKLTPQYITKKLRIKPGPQGVEHSMQYIDGDTRCRFLSKWAGDVVKMMRIKYGRYVSNIRLVSGGYIGYTIG